MKFEIAIFLSFLFFACFQAWREQYERAAPREPSPTIQVNVPAISVAPPQVIIERPAGSSETPTLSGFLVIEQMLPVDDLSVIAEGRSIGFNIVFTQRGNQPVHDVHNFETLSIVEPTDAASRAARQTFRSEQKMAHQRAFHEHIDAPSVGLGQQVFNTAVLGPLTKETADSILRGKNLLYLQAWANWKDLNGNTGTIDECWLMVPPVTSKLTAQVNWHNCVNKK